MANLMDGTCPEGERLFLAYEEATHCQRIIEHNSVMETGLEVLVRKASNRCETARRAVEDHEVTHMTVKAMISPCV